MGYSADELDRRIQIGHVRSPARKGDEVSVTRTSFDGNEATGEGELERREELEIFKRSPNELRVDR